MYLGNTRTQLVSGQCLPCEHGWTHWWLAEPDPFTKQSQRRQNIGLLQRRNGVNPSDETEHVLQTSSACCTYDARNKSQPCNMSHAASDDGRGTLSRGQSHLVH